MILGIGTDLIDVARMERAAQRHDGFLDRVFTPGERAYCDSQHRRYEGYAARFAAKEAFLKALGTGLRDGITWHDMEVVRDDQGRPELVLGGRALEVCRERGVARQFVSLSHTGSHGLAVVVLEGTGGDGS